MNGLHPARETTAYRQGCAWGLSGKSEKGCPYPGTNLACWWEIGWHDGHEALIRQRRRHSSCH